MLIFLTYILFSISAILNAFMDIIENENFHSSVFKNLNQKFWYKRESWKNKYKKITIRIPWKITLKK